MFIALNSNKERVDITKVNKECAYFCPVCNEKLSVKALNSSAVKPHFAHKKNTECLDNWKHDMSDWHYDWQNLFPEEYREVVVEKDGIKHRADILINDTVIEFQHSPITADEIAQRNSFYLSCGYRVIWVFDATGKIKNEYGGTLDPSKNPMLVWKRAKSEFRDPMPGNVQTLIEYTSDINTTPPSEEKIMILLKNVNSKNIDFVDTRIRAEGKDLYMYLTKWNLLKQFNIIDDSNVYSIYDILNKRVNNTTPPATKRYVISPPYGYNRYKRRF